MTDEDLSALIALEESLWRRETRFDRAYMERLLAEEFIEIGRSGRVYSRSAILAVTDQPIEAKLPLPGLVVREISKDVLQVTYNSRVVCNGEVEKGRRSSLWRKAQRGWVLVFHQGTPYFEPE